jgi:hypothetical protein
MVLVDYIGIFFYISEYFWQMTVYCTEQLNLKIISYWHYFTTKIMSICPIWNFTLYILYVTVFICLKITQIQNNNSSLLHEDKLLWLIYIDCTLYTGIQYIKIFHFITPNFSPIPKHNFFSLLTQLLAFTDT